MIRRVSHSLNFSTQTKRKKLDSFFDEYSRLVNAFINLYWNQKTLPSKANSQTYSQIDSWLMGKARKCAVNQATKIVKSTWKKDRQLTYKAYQKVYSRAKNKNKNISLVNQKWSEWNKGRTFRHRVKLPFFRGFSIDLNSDLVRIQEPKKSIAFDLWIRLGSIFGNRYSLVLPTKHHKVSRRLENKGWKQKSSITLRKTTKGYFADVYWKKPEESTVKTGSKIGVDIGIQKLMTFSNGQQLGKDLRPKLDKLNRREQHSHNWNQTVQEIKDYIGYTTNRFPWNKASVVVMEDIKGITQNTKSRINKTVRKLLGHWNMDLLYRRMQEKAAENRVQLAFVNPAYFSQMCFSCKDVNKKSRHLEKFKCRSCGYEDDADHNASLNILQGFLDGEFTVSRSIGRY